jgi:hypothetical protein
MDTAMRVFKLTNSWDRYRCGQMANPVIRFSDPVIPRETAGKKVGNSSDDSVIMHGSA